MTDPSASDAPPLRRQLAQATGSRRFLVRAAHAAALAEAGGTSDYPAALRDRYPADGAAAIVLRAATSVGGASGSTWADALASTAVSDFVSALAPTSAAARLFESAFRVETEAARVAIPSIAASSDRAAFVAPGGVLAVETGAVTGPILAAAKIGAIAVATREAIEHSGAEAVIEALLTESAAAALDAGFFGAQTATDATPAGLRAVATTIASTSGGGAAALTTDLAALLSAVKPFSAAGVVLAASPGTALKMAILTAGALPLPVLPSAAIPDATVLAICPRALAVSIDPTPRLQAATEALLHFEDGSPAQIGTVGSPNAVAAPSRSLYQVDAVAVRAIVGVSWALRATGAAAMISAISW